MKGATKRRLRRGALALVAGLAVAFATVASGVVPIAASSGHWPVTEWLLHFAMRRSVATHSAGIEPPALDDPALLRLGAGHYEGACRLCHGAPGDRLPPLPHGMTPHPPWLPHRVPSMSAAELYYTVQNGVKFTGMPAWPALQREDEPWAVVAFLQQLPDLSQAGYRELLGGPEAASEASGRPPQPGWIRERCARCHGADGLGRDGTAPVLAGQRAQYLSASLRAYASGQRHSGFMEHIASGMRGAEIRAAADHYASLPGLEPAPAPGRTRGAQIASRGIPERRIPPCADCHGPSEHPRREAFPLLAGQHPRWIERQLEAFASRTRGGTAWVELMRQVVAHDLEPAERRAVAAFYGG